MNHHQQGKITIDEVMSKWILRVESGEAITNDMLLKEKALVFAKETGVFNFKDSTGLVEGSKERHCLKYRVLHGKCYSETPINFTTFESILKSKIFYTVQ